MTTPLARPALDPMTVKPSTGSGYPTDAMKAVTAGSEKRMLGDALGLTTFGVNLTTLPPGAASALRHWHLRQDEFVFVIEGELTLVTDEGEQTLGPGACAGFPGGIPNGHHLVNRSTKPATYIEVGDRLPGDGAEYADHDLRVRSTGSGWRYTHKDGSDF
jgi:uncharacterized cupin superfamily protein